MANDQCLRPVVDAMFSIVFSDRSDDMRTYRQRHSLKGTYLAPSGIRNRLPDLTPVGGSTPSSSASLYW